jgi:hypothetical protein
MPESPEELPIESLKEVALCSSEGDSQEIAETEEFPDPPKECNPMLDVHPAPHAAHSWKDFLIHIATIVLGLLIAVGLEQTVEYVHRRAQVREARSMLDEELKANADNLASNTREIDAHLVHLWDDLAVVQRARAHTSRPGEQILFVHPFSFFQSTAWQTIHASAATEHMDPQLLADYGNLYLEYQSTNEMTQKNTAELQGDLAPLVTTEDRQIETTAQIEEIEAKLSAGDIALSDPINQRLSHTNHPERLSPAQLDAVEQAITRGIIADRRLQRYLAAVELTQAAVRKQYPQR